MTKAEAMNDTKDSARVGMRGSMLRSKLRLLAGRLWWSDDVLKRMSC